MPYSDFDLRDLEQHFKLEVREHSSLFAQAPEAAPGDLLTAILAENLPLALAINTEKARSEMLIAPILIEVRRMLQHRVSLFSGVDFGVDPGQGLSGTCDFILSLSPLQQVMHAPIVAIVEAKNENLKSVLAQCVAALLFNQREGKDIARVFGAVTTGSLWRFLQLETTKLTLDLQEYHIERIAKILGILIYMLTRGATSETKP